MVKLLLWQRRLSLLALCFAFIVIGLGALTRLVDAGLGCPDWPGCYGHLTVIAAQADRQLTINYPQTAFIAYKAWAEMVHRYCAGILSCLISIVLTLLIYRGCKTKRATLLLLAAWLLLLIIYQIMLGRWTVTLQLLPTIVSQHLLGGFLIISTLGLCYFTTTVSGNKPQRAVPTMQYLYFALSVVGWLLLLLQIFLGAWTSTHYAALSCDGFPFCKTATQHVNFMWQQAFTWHTPQGLNYDGGLLPTAARQTIQMAHRFGAAIVFTYWLIFFSCIWQRLAAPILTTFYFILILMVIQIVLGIANAVFLLPVVVAILHNMVAAGLLLAIVRLIWQLYPRRQLWPLPTEVTP